MSSFDDEIVSQFLAFTGSADTDRAASYLEMSGGDLETAVGLFMEYQGNAPGAAGAAAGGETPHFGGDHGGMGDVRAPDETRTMRLMDDVRVPGGMMFENRSHLYMQLHPEQMATSAFARDVVNQAAAAAGAAASDFGDDMDDDYDDDYGGDEADASAPRVGGRASTGSAARVAGLADMFAPPHDLIYKEGGFEGARTMAKDNKRWLLVNLQRDAEFSCHALNRDVWRDELVENLVREGFIFWQDMDTSPDGTVYAQRYHVHDYPHVGIVDPRTRRLLWKREGWTQQNPFTAEHFAEIAMDFCSRHSFDRPPQAPRPNTAAAARPPKRPVNEMSEDEQLQAAMQASLTGTTENGVESIDVDDDDDDDCKMAADEDDDDDVVVVGSNWDEVNEAKPKATEEPAKPPAAPSLFDQWVSIELGDEPANGARIQFRMPDGKRQIRRFDSSANLNVVYAFVAQSMAEADSGKEFILMAGYPPKDLINDVNNTIESCSLAGEAITVRWK